MFRPILIFAFFIALAAGVRADTLILNVNQKTHHLTGEILITAQDESLYFRENDGTIWFVKPDQIIEKSNTDEPVEAISKRDLGEKLLEELPPGFRIYQTRHYVIAYQNELDYARWIGGLYESRLYRGFETFWEKKKKFELTDPEFPLVAIIFGSAAEYQRYVDRELGTGQSMVAYYNLQTNRVTMYDLTADRRNPNQKLTDRKIDEILQAPAVAPMVATIIHEGTHQLMFNRGLQTRFAESPLWLNEGLAMYFETPAVGSSRGWRVPGLISNMRLLEFRNNLASRPANNLRALIESDEPFRNQDTLLASYSEAWAFNHFLLNRRSEDYVKYLRHMSGKKALREDTPETRIQEFQQFLGDDWEQLETDFLKYVHRMKR